MALSLLLAAGAAWAQKEWREYPSIERGWYGRGEMPTDAREPGEFVVGRLMFPQTRRGRALGAGRGDWLQGATAWTVDYPEGDRTFARLLERLTMVDVRVVEQPVNLDDDDRVMVMITFNNDIADGWQRADEYRYPQEAANLAIALGVNFAVYALTH